MNDVFRQNYNPVSPEAQEQIKQIKQNAQLLWEMMDKNTTPSNAREMALAKTNIEQSIMWAVKALTG